MKSKNDPILDAQAVCAEGPVSKDELATRMEELGWGVPIDDILEGADGTYISRGEDGLYRPIQGATVEDAVRKALRK